MRIKTPLAALGISLAFLLTAAPPALAADSPWDLNIYLNTWGLGLGAEYGGFTLLPDREASLFLSICGTYEDWGFYRNPDDSLYNPPDSGPDLGEYKRMDYVWSAGLKQDLSEDSTLFAFYKGRYDENLEDDSPSGSLIFLSGLPDAVEITQHSILLGAAYDTIVKNPDSLSLKGFHAEASYEIAPGSLNEIADFACFNITLYSWLPVMETGQFSLFLGDRLIYDHLSGDYVPINARTSYGGLRAFPGRQVPGVGDGVRGVQVGRFDGNEKVLNNLELRATFPELLGGDWVPGLVLYYDFSVSDHGTGDLDWDETYSSVGLGISMHTGFGWDLVFYANYFVEEELTTTKLELGMQF